MNYKESVLDVIGNTPLIKLSRYCAKRGFYGEIYGKMECYNPGGSAKDRPGLNMLRRAEELGIISEGATVIEPTSGNTGIGLAVACAVKGYKLVLTMPETMSIERRKLAAQYGADIVLTEGKLGMKGAVDKAVELAKSIPNSFIPQQFANPANPEAHRLATGKEILRDMDNEVDFFVAGVGTGGTLTGCAQAIKSAAPDCKIIAVEPAKSPLISQGTAGSHGLMGIGANFIPENLDIKLIDQVITVTEEQAYDAAKSLAKEEGVLVGISSGAAVYAAGVLAAKKENEGKKIVVIIVDTGERYLSTPLFN